MKIIHTSDLHLGKRLEGKSRIKEQEEALAELEKLARDIKADAVVIAGDIFDTVNPPAEAESLFYSSALALSRQCAVIAIAGNHDNPDRLSAPDGIARECGIILGGGLDFSHAKTPMEGGEGRLSLTKTAERVNLALLPYPSSARMSQLGYEINADKSYSEHVREWLSLCSRGFRASECNITVSHLFMAGSARAGEEAELGTAALLPLDILPESHYTALGHVHKPQCMSRKKNVYYSGSLLKYSFDDTSDKFFNILETNAAGVNMTQVPIASGKKLVTVTVKDFDGAMAALDEHAGAYVRILYDCATPLSASKYAEMRGKESFAAFRNIFTSPKAERTQNKLRSDREYFADFYASRHDGEKPRAELYELFDKAMRIAEGKADKGEEL